MFYENIFITYFKKENFSTLSFLTNVLSFPTMPDKLSTHTSLPLIFSRRYWENYSISRLEQNAWA